MSEPGEVSIPILDTESQDGARLTAEQIAAIHIRENVRYGILHRYTSGQDSVSLLFRAPDLSKLSDEEQAEIASFLSGRENSESYRYELLLVNALLEQLRIAQKFGLTEDSIYRSINLDVVDQGSILLDDWGTLYLRALDKSVRFLRQQGVTDDEIITEIAGQIFHESVHNAEGNMSEVLFNGRSPFGEITTVTTQMAYYIDEDYKGSTPYDNRSFRAGLSKAQNGVSNSRDYDIATYVGGTLILGALREAYPRLFSEIKETDPIAVCHAIAERLSPDERETLIPTLKKAIANSADEEVFEEILNQTKQKKRPTRGHGLNNQVRGIKDLG